MLINNENSKLGDTPQCQTDHRRGHAKHVENSPFVSVLTRQRPYTDSGECSPPARYTDSVIIEHNRQSGSVK